MSHFVRTIVFVFSFSLISACNNNKFNESVSVTFHDEKYEIIPVAMSMDHIFFDKYLKDGIKDEYVQDFFNVCADDHLAQFVSWVRTPNYAFRNAKGEYLTFDNDGDYSDLCLLPTLVFGVNQSQFRNPIVGGNTVIKDLCDSFHLDYDEVGNIFFTPSNVSLSPSNKEIRTWNSPEISAELETHYNQEIKSAVTQLLSAMALYLKGNEEDIDSEYRDQIEKYIFDKHHPEYLSFYKHSYSYNMQSYLYQSNQGESGPLMWDTKAFPVENENFITITGESLPKGTLVLSFK